MTTRRHPLAFAAYLVSFAFGLIFVLGLVDTSVVFASISPMWQMLWEWELLSGGAVAAVALVVRPRVYPHWPDLADVLRFEGIGGVVSGFGMFTYAVVLIQILGWATYSWALMMILGAGLVIRGVQAIFESTRVERLGALNEAAQSVLQEAHRVHVESGGYIRVDQDSETNGNDQIQDELELDHLTHEDEE